MHRSLLAIGIVCLLSGVLQRGGLAQARAGQSKGVATRQAIALRHVRLADIGAERPSEAMGGFPYLRSAAFTRLSFLPPARPFFSRPLVVRPATADAWNTGSGNWSVRRPKLRST